MRHHLALASLLAAALATGCGQPVLSAQLSVPEIDITQPGQPFDPLNPTSVDKCPPTITSGCVFRDLSYDLQAQVPVFDQKGVTYDVRLLSVSLDLKGADLSAIQGARILLPDGGGGFTTVASYEKPPGGTIPTTVSVSGKTNLDLAPYIHGGVLDVRVEMDYDAAGSLSAFTADISAGFSVLVTLDYQAFL